MIAASKKSSRAPSNSNFGFLTFSTRGAPPLCPLCFVLGCKGVVRLLSCTL